MTTNNDEIQPANDDEPISLDAEIDRLMAMGGGGDIVEESVDENAEENADENTDDRARRTADDKIAEAAEEHQARRAAGERPPRGKL
jgi:hypothetical protein